MEMRSRVVVLVVLGLGLGLGVAAPAVARADAFDEAAAKYFGSFEPQPGGSIVLSGFHEMWMLSPTRSLEAMRAKVAQLSDMAVEALAMSVRQDMMDPRLAAFMRELYQKAQPLVQRDLAHFIAADGATQETIELLQGARNLASQDGGVVDGVVELAVDRYALRDVRRLGQTDVLVEVIAQTDIVGLSDQALLRGERVIMEGEVTEEGRFRTVVKGVRVEARFERDAEARAKFTPKPGQGVRLAGFLNTANSAADNGGKKVEFDLAYAELSASGTPPPKFKNAGKKKSGCGCDVGGRPGVGVGGAGVALGLGLGLLGALLLAARLRRRA